MSYFVCVNRFFTLLFLLCFARPSFAQTPTQNTDDNEFLLSIWENDGHILAFRTLDDGSIKSDMILKTFYGFYYDGIYTLNQSLIVPNFARIDDGLYIQYWISAPAYSSNTIENQAENTQNRATGIYWQPAGNQTEFQIDTVPIQTEVLAYYIDEENIYKIRYWLAPVEFTDEKAELTLKTVKNTADSKNTQNTTGQSVFINKYITIGKSVYTCASGLNTVIRNVTTIKTLPGTPKITANEGILVLDAPYLVRSDITNLTTAMEEHNSIIYPPRDGRPRFVEPSIYTTLKKMTIEDFTIEGGEDF